MKVTDFIIAEDIRYENGNKLSIMGIYNDEITVSLPDDQWPIPFKFAVYIRINDLTSNSFPNRFLLKVTHNDEDIIRGVGQVQVISSKQTIVVPIVLFPFPLHGYGAYSFCLEVFKDNDLLLTDVRQIEVKKGS
jgi:hypothetical protein